MREYPRSSLTGPPVCSDAYRSVGTSDRQLGGAAGVEKLREQKEAA